MNDSWMKKRIICDLDTRRPGPVLLCTAGIHGNEPAGGRALMNILETLRTPDLLRGRLLALTGNMQALATGDRYQAEDLNRIWLQERVDRLMTDKSSASNPEEEEMAALLPIIHHALEQAQGEFCLLDLHSTSGEGAPFACCMEVTHHRQFMESFRIPMILGLRPRMQGTLMDYIARFGHSAVGVEGGQNDDPDTVLCHEAVIRISMVAIGMMDPDERHDADIALLRERCRGLPRYLEVKHRYIVGDEDEFSMLPGFANFSEIKEGQVVARDRNGDIHATDDGVMLFPRYQAEGADGFFLAQPTSL